MPESTLTPAPVIHATLPGARNAVIRSIAAAGVIVRAGEVAERTAFGMVGTEIRMPMWYCDTVDQNDSQNEEIGL